MENETPPESPKPQENQSTHTAPPSRNLVDTTAVIFSKYPKVSKLGEGTMPEADEKLWALGSHLGALVCMSSGLGFLAPLVIYLMQKDKSPFVACQAKEALNFHLTFMIFAVICGVLFWLVLPILLLMAAGILLLVGGIVAGIKSYEGEFFALPFTIRMIK
ncbi:MAG: DUF4870 domain-containing protein [Verrucomicrobiales bacterium]|nr:DUF4870 domain-containing protein [Verrucomicrobiales bacterium]